MPRQNRKIYFSGTKLMWFLLETHFLQQWLFTDEKLPDTLLSPSLLITWLHFAPNGQLPFNHVMSVVLWPAYTTKQTRWAEQ